MFSVPESMVKLYAYYLEKDHNFVTVLLNDILLIDPQIFMVAIFLFVFHLRLQLKMPYYDILPIQLVNA